MLITQTTWKLQSAHTSKPLSIQMWKISDDTYFLRCKRERCTTENFQTTSWFCSQEHQLLCKVHQWPKSAERNYIIKQTGCISWRGDFRSEWGDIREEWIVVKGGFWKGFKKGKRRCSRGGNRLNLLPILLCMSINIQTKRGRYTTISLYEIWIITRRSR